MLPKYLLLAPVVALLCIAVQAEELPRSPACRTALNALDEAEEAIAATASASGSDQQRRQAVAARLQPLRKRVADACLGGLTASPPPSQRTWVVPQAPDRPVAAVPRLPQPATPTVVLPRLEPPVAVTHCAGATCFASDGSILTRVGPQQLVGPRGSCSVQGNLLRCP